MRTSNTGHTRRQLLIGAAVSVTALAGCDAEPSPTPPPDPLQPLLDEALALAAAYDRAIAADPGSSARLTPLAADHRAHAAELNKLITPVTPASPAASAGAAADNTVASLRAAEQTAQRNAVAACQAAPAERAALVGSIAACRATHAEALR